MIKRLKDIVLASTLFFITSCASEPIYIPGPNKVVLTINSEPPGARVYVGDSYSGTTPLNLWYGIKDINYDEGIMTTGTIVVGKEGYLPQRKKELRLRINSEWKNTNDQNYYFSDLFVLEGDPRYIYSNSKNENTNTNTNKDSDMGELNKGIDALYKTLMLNDLLNRK